MNFKQFMVPPFVCNVQKVYPIFICKQITILHIYFICENIYSTLFTT